MSTFAEELNTIRKKRHLTQESLAEQLNVSRTTISRWETGAMVPDIDTVKRLSQLLDYNFLTTAHRHPTPRRPPILCPRQHSSQRR